MTHEKIAIITDSTSDLPLEYTQEHGVYVLPLKVIYPHEEYHDRVDIQPDEVYSRFPEEIPSTSMPAVSEAHEVFQDIQSKGIRKVLAIHISSGLSGTYGMVKMVAQEYPDLEIEVVDSKALSFGLGFLVMTAVKLVAAGYQFSDIVPKIYAAQKKTKVIFVLKTLEYLKKGGRIGLVSATLGEFLDLKPIISINEEGKYFTLTKVRTRKKSLERLKDIVMELTGGKLINLAVLNGDAQEEADQLRASLLADKSIKVAENLASQIGPVMVVHTGPGLIGISYQEVE